MRPIAIAAGRVALAPRLCRGRASGITTATLVRPRDPSAAHDAVPSGQAQTYTRHPTIASQPAFPYRGGHRMGGISSTPLPVGRRHGVADLSSWGAVAVATLLVTFDDSAVAFLEGWQFLQVASFELVDLALTAAAHTGCRSHSTRHGHRADIGYAIDRRADGRRNAPSSARALSVAAVP